MDFNFGRRSGILVWFLVGFLIFLDQFSKFFFGGLRFFEDSFFYVGGSVNYGSALGIFGGVSFYLLFVILLSFFAVFLILRNYGWFMGDWVRRGILIFLLGGVFGNLIDRIFFGYVRDFLGLRGFFVFNLADVYLSLAFVLFLVYEFWERKRLSKK